MVTDFNKTSLLYNLMEQIADNNDIEALVDIIKISLSSVFDVSEINLFFIEDNALKICDVLNNFEYIEERFSSDKLEVFDRIINSLQTAREYVLNDDITIPQDVFDEGDYIVKSLSFGLKTEGNLIGLFRLKFRQKKSLSFNEIRILKLISIALSLKVKNLVLSNKLEVNLEFYKSMKNIAKIIETQYDYQYIIPLIGEMIDKFVINHLIYIFLKKGDKFVLYWPNACWNKRVYELMDRLTIEEPVIISEDKKIGLFGLLSEKGLTGCIVAYSTLDKLTDNEIKYISELSCQSAITIEKANAYSDMLKNATLDALTVLNNRRQFEIRLKEQYSISNRQLTPLCAIMTDIDFFKKFNDNYGHSVGDEVLKLTANVIKAELREYDIASRYGGEEFCILLPNTAIDEAKVVAERLRYAVENSKIDIKSEKTSRMENISVTISVGVAQLEAEDMPEDLYMKADKALYDAKESGRNRVVIYEK